LKPPEVIKHMLTRFADVEDLKHEGVFFKTNMPWRAPKAYLHILFPPAPPDLIAKCKVQLSIPDPVTNLFEAFNGISLFSGNLEIYGLLPDSYLLNRNDWRCRLPFNLETETRRWRKRFQSQKLFWFGSYRYDRSPICMSQESLTVTAFEGNNLDNVRGSWGGLDLFFEEEVARLCAFFDEKGRTNVPDSELLPTLNVH
jgi:hypothetical protein